MCLEGAFVFPEHLAFGMFIHFLQLAFSAGVVYAAPLAVPTVQLDNATLIGVNYGRVSKFLGIPFAKPP